MGKKRKLNRHIAMKHNELCPFACNQCSKRFSRECDLKRHKHKKDPIELKSSSSNKKFVGICNECQQSFDDKSLYKKHLKQHLKDEKKKRKKRVKKIKIKRKFGQRR